MTQVFERTNPSVAHQESQSEASRLSPHEQALKNRKERLYPGLGLTAVILIGAAGFNTLSHDAKAGHEYDGPINPDIAAVTIYDGANVRSDPHRVDPEFNNLLDTVSLEDGIGPITVETPNGAYSSEDNNGRWYGISVEDLEGLAEAQDIAVDSDGDGIVWINEQRASATVESDQ